MDRDFLASNASMFRMLLLLLRVLDHKYHNFFLPRRILLNNMLLDVVGHRFPFEIRPPLFLIDYYQARSKMVLLVLELKELVPGKMLILTVGMLVPVH